MEEVIIYIVLCVWVIGGIFWIKSSIDISIASKKLTETLESKEWENERN